MAYRYSKTSTSKEINKSPEKRLLALAAEIAEAKDVQVPRLLLKLEGILECYQSGSVQLKGLKEAVYGYDLLSMLLTSLKQDFGKMPEGWLTASRLANLLSVCCTGIEVPETEEFTTKFLPTVLDQELTLAKKLQNRFIKTSEVLEDTRNDLLLHFRSVLDAVCVLYSGREFLCQRLLGSAILMQMLLTEDVSTCVIVMSSIQSVNRLRPTIMKEIGEKLYQQYMDEFIFKLAATASSDIANAATRTVLVICDAYKSTVEYLCTRYKGLRLLLQRWQGKGFDRDVRRLTMLLDAGTHQQAEMAKLHLAAKSIQAFWRSYAIRKKLSTLDRAVGSFHRSFRAKKELERRRQEEFRRQGELKHWLMLERKKTMRELRYRQLKAIQLLPAGQVERHLAEEENNAALRIQRQWRGFCVRAGIEERRHLVYQGKAAITIQRAVRKWIDKQREKRREPPNWQRPPGLTDERRVELLERIQEHREKHAPKTQGAEKREELHYRVQAMLKNHAIGSKKRRKDEMHRNALLARLDTDAQLLIPCPTLSEVKVEDLASFVCHTIPVATAARHNHTQELRLLRQPWWKKLGDEYQDMRLEEEAGHWKSF